MRHRFAIVTAALLQASTPVAAAERSVVLTIENMSCAACPFIVQKTLAAVPGVRNAEISFEEATATVIFDDSQTNVAALITATTEAGYPSRLARR
jgi:periplasmic mercuric ion binding protein